MREAGFEVVSVRNAEREGDKPWWVYIKQFVVYYMIVDNDVICIYTILYIMCYKTSDVGTQYYI